MTLLELAQQGLGAAEPPLPRQVVLAELPEVSEAVVLGVPDEPYWLYSAQGVDTWQIMEGVFKSFFFGAAIAIVSCYQGFNCKAGADGVAIGARALLEKNKRNTRWARRQDSMNNMPIKTRPIYLAVAMGGDTRTSSSALGTIQ